MHIDILVVEDESSIQLLLKATLEKAGYHVRIAGDVAQAKKMVADVLPDCVLVDWMLPGESGIQFSRSLRVDARTRPLPIIMLTAKAMEDDKVAGLEAGADDYLTKPFSPKELVARIQALLRRRAPEQAEQVLNVGIVELNPTTHQVLVSGKVIEIGPTEFNILKLMLAHPERVFTRPQMLNKVWGDHVFIDERTIDVHMRRLRLALGEEAEGMIQTIRGVGYKLSVLKTS